VKVVLDTNVLLAGFCFKGLCQSVIEVCLDAHDVILSEWSILELRQNLTAKFGHSPAQADDRCRFLRDVATVLQRGALPALAEDECRDPDDLFILATAVAGKADCIVTGDKDLLDLGEYQGIAILTPRRFWERLRSSPST
jgi:putative PIN family toxin of toxin-antitoxin system